MKTAIVLSLLSAAALAGCATETTQVAQADCKLAPMTTTSMSYGGASKSKPVSSLDQRYAEMALATSDYRFNNLRRNGPAANNVEDALRDCN